MMYRRGGRPPQQTMTIPGPSMGWLKSSSFLGADQRGAEVLDNFFPTAQGARIRKGSVKQATTDAAVKSLFTYEGGGGDAALYAATAAAVYDVTSPADADTAEIPAFSLQTGGAWSTVHFSTSGGDFVIGVNGTDPAFLNNGTAFQPISSGTVYDLAYTGLTGEFEIGLTITGGTSSATAVVVGDYKTSATAGTLKIITVAGGPFQAEAITDTGTGAASATGAETSASTIAISGVSTSALSHVWAHQRRLWFIEGETMSAWYLATVSIGGTATEFPMGGLFQLGGSLLFGANWTVDSGEGMDDMAVFVTTEGEVAVYSGTDPSNAATWGLQGLYRIGRPLGKNAWFRSAGDLQILTEDGIVSLTDAMRYDQAQMLQRALSYPIEDEWLDVVANRSGSFDFSATLWPSQTMLICGVPAGDDSYAFVANARTGAWGRFTGWDIQCSTVFNDAFYFGTSSSTVVRGETTGADQGEPYVARWVPKFSEMGMAEQKYASLARVIYRASQVFSFTVQAFSDYTVGKWASAPPAQTGGGGAVWGTATWGNFVWGGDDSRTAKRVQKGVAANGFALAPAFQTTSGTTEAPDLEIVAASLQFEAGAPI